MANDVIGMAAAEAINSGRLEGEKLLAERIVAEKMRHRIVATDGDFHSFTTAAIIFAAERKWGQKSRRTKEIYILLKDMIIAREAI